MHRVNNVKSISSALRKSYDDIQEEHQLDNQMRWGVALKNVYKITPAKFHRLSKFAGILSWSFLSCLLLNGCTGSNTDPLEPHQIVSAPAKQWIRWSEEAPLDVTQDKIKTKQVCPRQRKD